MNTSTDKQMNVVEEALEIKLAQTENAGMEVSKLAYESAIDRLSFHNKKGFERFCELLSIEVGETTLNEQTKRKCQILLNVLKNIGEPQVIDSYKVIKQLNQQIQDAKTIFKANCEALNEVLKPLKTVWLSLQEIEDRSKSTGTANLNNMSILILDPIELENESNRNEILAIVQDELQSKNNKPEKFEAYTYVLVPNFHETPLPGANKLVEALLSDIMNQKERIFSYFVHTDVVGDTPQKVFDGHKFNTSEEKYKHAIFSSMYAVKENYGKIQDINLAISDQSGLRIPPSMMLHGYLVNPCFDVNEVPFGETNFENNHTLINTQVYFQKYGRHISDPEIDNFSARKITVSRIKHTPQSGHMYVYIENTYNGWTAKGAANLGDVKVDIYIKRTLAEFIHRNIKGLKINKGVDKLREAIDVFFNDLKKRKVIADLLVLDVEIPDDGSGNAADTLRIKYEVKVEGQVHGIIISKTKGSNKRVTEAQ